MLVSKDPVELGKITVYSVSALYLRVSFWES